MMSSVATRMMFVTRSLHVPTSSKLSRSSCSTRNPSLFFGKNTVYFLSGIGRRNLSSKNQRRAINSRNEQWRRKKATLAGGGRKVETAGDTLGSSEQITFSRFREAINQYLNKPRTVPIPRWVSPQHSMISLSECFGHSSFILVAISYAVDDFIQLRLIAIAGSTAMLVFAYFHPHGRILWLPFKWNVLFIVLNAYRVIKVYADRFLASQLSPLMMHMHDHHFYVMELADFARLVRLGTIEQYRKGEVVVKQDQENRYVRLVLQGTLNVERDGQVTYQLHEGNFISETGLHAGLLLRGNVNSCCDVKANDNDVTVLAWDRTDLMHLLEVDKNIQRAIKAVMSWDIVSKLKSQRGLLASGLVPDPEEWTRKRREQTLHRYKSILRNMLAHPYYLNMRREELSKYRDIHHIDDDQHELALKEMGWTLEEFENGNKAGQVDENLANTNDYYGWKWYAQEVYFRVFG